MAASLTPALAASPVADSAMWGSKRRHRNTAEYVRVHRERLEKVAQLALNRVLETRPPDPFEALLQQLSEYTEASILFSDFRVYVLNPDSICCEVLADIRGSCLSIQSVHLSKEDLARGLFEGRSDDVEVDELCVALQSSLAGVIKGKTIQSFAALHESLCSAFSTYTAALHVRNVISSLLLSSISCLRDSSTTEVVRKTLTTNGSKRAPPLTCREDLGAWQHQLPEVLLPALTGGTPSRRLFVGATLWAATQKDAAAVAGVEPLFVDMVAVHSRAVALAQSHADMSIEDPDEVPLPEADQLCPPLNSVTMVARLLQAVVTEVASKSSCIPGPEDFMAALGQFREAIVSLNLESEELAKSHCIYCGLDLDADAAFDAQTGLYTFSKGGEQPRTQAEMIDYCVKLCEAEPLLGVLVSPLSKHDGTYEDGLTALRGRLPTKVAIIVTPSESGDGHRNNANKGDAENSQGGNACPGGHGTIADTGYVRDLSQTALGLAVQCEQHADLYDGRHALYDFDQARDCLSAIDAYAAVSLALPESSRRMILPIRDDTEELSSQMQPLDSMMRRCLAAAYRRKVAVDGREKLRCLNIKQWTEGLRRLGYKEVDQYAKPLFQFLDVSNNGWVSPSELQVLHGIRGPANLRQLDEFRVWLCQWQERYEQLAGTSDNQSPMAKLWQRMDINGSGMVSFVELKQALRTMKHPAVAQGNVAHLHELFMSLDLNNSGTVCEREFDCWNVLSAQFQLQRVAIIRDFLRERFGTLKAAFKAMDVDRDGELSRDEWLALMCQQGYEIDEDCKVCFHFIDVDASLVVTNKEFDFLEKLDENRFLDDMQALQDHLEDVHGTLEDAFEAFQQTRTSEDDISGQRDFLERGEFLAGCSDSGFGGVYDPRLLFNFLDAMHVGQITLAEFLMLGKLDAVEDLEAHSARSQNAISSLRTFAEGRRVDEGESAELWLSLHQELRSATHGDMDLD